LKRYPTAQVIKLRGLFRIALPNLNAIGSDSLVAWEFVSSPYDNLPEAWENAAARIRAAHGARKRWEKVRARKH
jgi:hypothetical protein